MFSLRVKLSSRPHIGCQLLLLLLVRVLTLAAMLLIPLLIAADDPAFDHGDANGGGHGGDGLLVRLWLCT